MPPPRRHFRRPSAPKPPPDEFCPQVPLPWKRELRKVQGRLPRLNKMRITLADERWSSPNRQWLTKKGRRRLEPIVSDDTGLGEAQEILAKDLMRELMADEVESQGSRAQTYRGTPDDEDVRSVLAHELCVRVVEPSSAEPERPGTERPEAQASEVHSHSDRPASSDVHSLVRRLFDSPEPPTEVASAAAADARDAEPPGADAAAAGAAWGAAVPGRMSPEVERLSEADASAGLARDVIRAAVPFRPAPCSTPPRSASELMVSEVSSHSHAARSMARNAIECHFAESTASPIHSDGQVPSIIEGDEAMQDVARDIVTNASMGNLRASPVSQLESGKTDSAAQSIARRAIQPHLGDSSAASHTRHSMDEIPSIIEGDEAMQDVARDIVTNASMGHLRASPVSQLESGKTDSAAQSIARRAIEPHLADSSAASHTRHSMDEIPSVIAGDEAVQDVARDIVTNASMGHLRASPVSQLESENTDSAARSIARRAIEPHLADSSAASNSKHSMDEIPSSQVEARSDMHQLKEEAGSDGYPAAQGVAREVIASATSRGTAEPHPATVQEQMHSEAEGYATAQGVARDCVASARQAPSPASPHSQVQSETVDSVAAQFVARQAVEPYRDGTGHPHPRHGVEVVEGSSGGASHDAIAHDTDSVVAQSITRQLVAMRQVEARSDMDHLKEEAGSDGYPAAQGVAREVIASATSRGIAEPHPATVQEQMHSEAEGYATAQVVARDCVTSAIQAPSPASPHSQVQSETVDSVAAQFVARQAVEPYRDSTGHPHPRHGVEVVEGSSGGATHDAISHDTDSVVAQSITRQLVAMSQVEARSDMDHLQEEAGSDGYPAAQGVAREVIASATSRGIAEPHPATVQEQMHSEAEGYATAQVVARDCVTSAIQAPSPASPHSQVQSEAVDSPSAGIIAGEAVKQA